MKSYGVTIHMKVTTSLLLNKCSPPPPFRPSDSMFECWQTTEHAITLTKKKRLKVVAFPTLLTISSDFSTLRNVLFQTQGNLSLHFDLGPLES